MPLTVLLATGDRDRRDVLENALLSLQLRIIHAGTGEEAVRTHERVRPGLVLTATDLPDLHALDLCRRIRRDSDIPLIVLVSDGAEIDRILALELGADDVVPADCGSGELQERVKAALRRASGVEPGRAPAEVLDFGEIIIKRSPGTLVMSGETRQLTPMETELLWMLAVHAGEVVESEALLESVWGYPPGIKTRTLDVHIGRLRRKLGEDGRNPRHIITVRSVGYRFEPCPDEDDMACAAA
ncbi:MAG: response regulator transcription factor [Armatimonadota bacterium]